jgi:glycosyltransferase involved in cell wall biosynthesis
MKITAHTLIKNESRWIWFALQSVLDCVDEIMVWDTGSTDNTIDIVQSIKSPKIKLKSIGSVDPVGHTQARQDMLDATDSDWILILDGDEIWFRNSLTACVSSLNPKLSALVSPFINLVGDIYHYQESKSSLYKIGPYHGAFNLRFINRKIPGLHVGNPHGRQEYRNADGIALQNLSPDNYSLVDQPYLHTTHLQRSLADSATLKRKFKHRYELGRQFSANFIYPESMYLPCPSLVPNPWVTRSCGYVVKSLVYSPLRLAKNLFIKNSSGY